MTLRNENPFPNLSGAHFRYRLISLAIRRAMYSTPAEASSVDYIRANGLTGVMSP